MTSPTFTLVHEDATPGACWCTRTCTGFAATRSTPRPARARAARAPRRRRHPRGRVGRGRDRRARRRPRARRCRSPSRRAHGRARCSPRPSGAARATESGIVGSMAGRRRPLGELLAMGVIAGLVAFGLAYATRPGAVRAPAATATACRRPGPSSSFIRPRRSSTVRSRDGAVSRGHRSRARGRRRRAPARPRPRRAARRGRRRPRDGAGADRRRDRRRELELRVDPARDALHDRR